MILTAVILFIAVIPFALGMSMLFYPTKKPGESGPGVELQAKIFAVTVLLALAGCLVFVGLSVGGVV